MSRRLALVALIGCVGNDAHETTLPAEGGPTCPSDATPDHCQNLAKEAALTHHGDLAWAYTVLDCESPHPGRCALMWKQYNKYAPTQTDALNVLHNACSRSANACEQLGAWHRDHNHPLAAAVYDKRAEAERKPGKVSENVAALSRDLAGLMHVTDTPRTDVVAQMVGSKLDAPITPVVAAAKPNAKAWPVHTAALATMSDGCTFTNAQPIIDRKPVGIDHCVGEVRPWEGDQIVLRNRCNIGVTVAFAGTRTDQTTFASVLHLEPYEALPTVTSHKEVGQLTLASCPNQCMPSVDAENRVAVWKGGDQLYYCSR